MTPTWIDHALAVFLTAVLPFLALRSFRKLQERMRHPDPAARRRGYGRTMARLWSLAIVVAAAWAGAGRALSDLGLGWRAGPGTWVGGGLTLAACALLFLQAWKIRRSPRIQAGLLPRFEPFRALLPGGEHEWGWWVGLSLTAGICEEITFRGFLMAYFGAQAGTVAAILGSSLVFGLGHLYQGAGGMARTAGTGLIVAGLYVLTGSLWASMLLHFFIDFTGGWIARSVLRQAPAPGAPARSVPE